MKLKDISLNNVTSVAVLLSAITMAGCSSSSDSPAPAADNNPPAQVVDTDNDGVEDSADNCPNDANANQEDVDSDNIGDACDPVDDRNNQQPAAEGTAQYVEDNEELKGDFAEDVTLEAGKTYKITGQVNFLEGTTLTIPAGTTLYGSTGASYLAINRGAMIDAQGTAANPIIFTSAQDVAGQNTGDEQGQWGGLTILGQSTNNKGERTYEAGTQLYGPKDGVTIEDDNSGVLKYVAIKYSGYEVEKDKELNGLSLGSVGSGTTIENIAIIGSADDGIEFWGGTVSVNGLYIYNAGDDSIDTDQGYIGTLENVYAEQNVVDDETGSRVIEADSHSEAEAGTPVAKPTLKNAILKSVGRAVRLREGTDYEFNNVQIIVDSSTDAAVEAIRVSDNGIGTGATVSGAGLAIKNNANSTALFSDGSEAEFTGSGTIYKDSDSSLNITAYSATWAGAADNSANSVSTGPAAEGTALYVSQNKELKGDFAEDVTLEAGETYKITGQVNFLEGTTLTIPAGTTLYGSTGASYLAINRGAMIDAQGTAADPIIFTSAQDVAGLNTGDEQGQWGGLTILGQSTNNKGERTYEAGTQLYGPKDGVTIEDDNSGILKHVAIKYSGYEVEKDKELNGLSLGSVGSGTTIENIAIIGSADDGIEFWGGTVNVTGLYIYNAGDDSIDTDQGYVGTLTNVYAEQNIVDDETGSRVIEADSHSEAEAGTPVAMPTLRNAILKSVGRAVRLREGTNYIFDNVQIIVDSSTDTAVEAIRVSDTGIGTGAVVTGSGLAIKNTANATALFSTGSEAEFTGTGSIYKDSDDSLNITAYSATWAGAADNSANSVTQAPAAEGTQLYVEQNNELKGDFAEDVTLLAGETYKITGQVNFLDGTTLTIPAGTTLYGSTGASYLAINRGAMIDAQGTEADPIIFTSAQDVAGLNTGDEQGQWGGLTILGQSTNNKGERTYEAGTQLYGPKDGVTIEDDNSGILKHVAIKYSGYEVEKDKELNGLSLGSVGSGTTIENIAIIGSADDGIEFWGGTVNVTGLYIYNAGDDSIDTDQGYVGTLTNVYAEQNIVDDETGSRVIEADSHSEAEAGTPVAMPTLRNAILKSVGRAVRLREGTNYIFDNVQIIVDSSTDTAVEAIRVSDTGIGTGAVVTGSGLAIKNTANATALFSTGSEAEFTGTGSIYKDSDDSLNITAYSATWAGAADNSANSVTQAPAAEGTQLYVEQNNELKGDFAEDVTLLAGETYKITGQVNFLDGTTLTIPAGTTLYGSTGASYLAINRGAMIDAQGTEADPIIFTSAQDVAGLNTGDEQGQWGGLTILGQSTNNKGERTYEAGTQLYGPKDGVTIEDDNSGILSYVAIKYSGYEVEKDKELNGLSLGSVGSGTTINNIAIMGSADDGIEFWGGTVNVTGLYIYNAGDDSIDTDQGYTGSLTNVYAEQNVVDDETGSRVIEADSHSEAEAGTPVATPTLTNAILKSVGRAVRLREGTNYVFDNVQIIVDSSTDTSVEAIRVSDTGIGTSAVASGSGLAIKNNANNAALFSDGSEAQFSGTIYSDSTDSLDITAYSATWAGAADNSAHSVTAGPAAEGTARYVSQNLELKGDFAEDVTLDASNTYKITGQVNFLDGTTLTIPAGTTLYGSTGASYLAINRGAMIDAQGTAVAPIIFTSAQDIAELNTGDEQGQWGGLTILGQSTNNKGERTYEAGTQLYGPKDGVTIEADNSGILNYVAIKYSGYEVEKDKELNGLSLGSVGSGTTLSNIAIIGSADDGIEFWGGTVSVDGLYIYNAGDDSIDTDQGFVGTLNNVYAEQNIVDDETGSRVIEADSHSEAEAGTPVATPTLTNAILKSVGRAVRLREGTNYVFDNVQITVESSTDTSVEAIRVSDTGIGTSAVASGSGLAVKNNANSTALFSDGSEAQVTGTVLKDDDTSLTITEYDASWAN